MGPGLLGVGIGAAIVAVAGVILAIALRDDPREPRHGMPVETLLAQTTRLAGKPVTVTGRVGMLADGALTLGEGDLLVVPADPGRPSFGGSRGLAAGRVVHARGVLRLVDAAGVRARLPGLRALPPGFRSFERRPVLFAEEVRPAS